MGASFFGGGLGQLVGAQQLDLSSVQQTYQALKANFDGNIDDTKPSKRKQATGCVLLGDQYTIYMNAKESADFNDSLTGNIGGGIGVEVGTRNNVPTIVRVLMDNPAEKVRAFRNQTAHIRGANYGESVKDMSLNDVVTKIRGCGDYGKTYH